MSVSSKKQSRMHPSAEWFRDLRFGIFVHWGIYSIAAKGEWLMMVERWPNEEYAKLVEQFNPKKGCVKSWVTAAKDAGAEYMVFTTRHHDGFCLFDSKASEGGFTSINSPAKHDFVAEFAGECRSAGMKVGFYYSLADWRIHTHRSGRYLPRAMDRLRRQAKEQLRELMTNYGKVDILWYDGPFGYDENGILWGKKWPDWHPKELNAMVRELQPGIAINNRCGSDEDFSTPEQEIRAAGGERAWEACMTMNDNWGYHKWDNHWKSVPDLIGNLVTCSAGGGSYLLNIGPMADGTVPEPSRERMVEIGKWVRAYGETLRGATRVDVPTGYTVLRKEDTLYIHQRNWPGSELRFVHCDGLVRDAYLVKSRTPIRFRQEGPVVTLSDMPEKPEDEYDTVVAISIR